MGTIRVSSQDLFSNSRRYDKSERHLRDKCETSVLPDDATHVFQLTGWNGKSLKIRTSRKTRCTRGKWSEELRSEESERQ